MANLGINQGTDVKLAADTMTLNGEAGVFRQSVMEVYDTVIDGRKTVAAAGTREALAGAATAARRVDITALSANTGTVVIGGSTCVAAAGARRGTPLLAGDTVTVHISDLANLYIDATVNGEGVSYTVYR